MKAIVYHNCDSPDVLQCEELETPTPGDNEVLIHGFDENYDGPRPLTRALSARQAPTISSAAPPSVLISSTAWPGRLK